MKLQGKVALITGGSRGIGRAIALAMAAEGARIALNYAGNHKAAQEVQQEIEKMGGECCVLQGNVGVLSEMEGLAALVVEKMGSIDILVNNAGITKDNLLLRMKEQDWDDVLNINLKGVFNCTKAASRYMIKQKRGKIINISSVVGLQGNAGQANYAAAKAGIIGFTKSMAKELGSRGITVNAIAPGFIQTDMTEILGEEIKSSLLKEIPLQRIGLPEDIAKAAVFLASSDADYITGQVLIVDGGMTI